MEHYNAVHQNRQDVDEIVQQNAAFGSEIARLRAQIEALQLLVDTDTLTPLANRRAFTRRLEFEIGQTARHQTKTIIAFIDVNGLKKINDQYGHVAGDTALCHVADILLRSFRATDLVARIGGDEFAVILDHGDEDAIAARMEALGRCLADSPLDLDGTPFPIGLAWGLTAVRGDDSVESAIRRADAVMYGSKSAV